MALGITLTIAGAIPASAGGPNDLFSIRGPAAFGAWSTCPEVPSSLDEVCMDTDVVALMATIKVNGTQVKEPCIVVQQFFYTFDPAKNFFISETIGILCGDGVQFRAEDLRLISASGTVPLTVCTPNADGTDVVCAPDGTTSTVDVTFTGYGPRYHFAGLTSKFQLGEAMCMWVDRGMFRQVTVSGTITGLVEPFGTFNQFSSISDQMSMRLSHGGECSR